MTNGQINKQFLAVTGDKTRNSIISAIASHYQISSDRAFDEVTDDGAEHLLDYCPASIRNGVSVLMQKRGIWPAPAIE
jgi:hypothetical protein